MVRSKSREGFTLLEVGMALLIAGLVISGVYGLISVSVQAERESVVLSNAVHLAKIKMAQIDSSSILDSDTSSGEIPGYPGFEYETEIKEEQLNLMKLAMGEENKNAKPADLLGGDPKMAELMKKRSGNVGSNTLGLIRVFRVRVTIKYPLGYEKNDYTVQTFKAAKY